MRLFDRPREYPDFPCTMRRHCKSPRRCAHVRKSPQRCAKPPDFDAQPRSIGFVGVLRPERPRDKHVVVTGRNAKPELIAIADLVTEMTLVKHPFDQGIKAQRGVDF